MEIRPDELASTTALQRAGATRRTFVRGEVVYHQGDGADAIHVVQQGHVALRLDTGDGDRLTLEVLGTGDVFGEEAALGGEALHPTSAVAADGVVTLALRRPELFRLRATVPSIDRELLAVAHERLQSRTMHLIDSLFAPADIRIVRRLAALAQRFTEGPRAVVHCTQADLAAMAGSSRATANRVLGQLERAGIVRVERRTIEILDARRLNDHGAQQVS